MQIKKLIKSQRLRHYLMKCGFWLPDIIMLSIQYRLTYNKRWPNLRHPERFTEWIQYYKMHYRNPVILQCVDKFRVREYVRDKIGEEYLVPLYAVTTNASSIDFDTLPTKFVIKTTDGGSGDNVLIVKDKSSLNISDTIKHIDSWRGKKYYIISREWAYRGAKSSQIIVEKLLESDANADGSIDDYKFLCFDGKFRYLWIDKDRYSNHHRGFWDEHLNFMPEVVSDHPTFSIPPVLPDNIADMISVAEKLAADFPFVRVDLYNISGKIIFGELTFYPWSGYVRFTPDSFDFTLGNLFKETSWVNKHI